MVAIEEVEELLEGLSPGAKAIVISSGIISGLVAGYSTIKVLSTMIHDIGK